MIEEKKISMAVIRRLPRYFRYLSDLMKLDIKRVSSKELSERMHITASQIRQDLNCFGGFGQQGYGYNVEYLYEEIAKILGIDKRFSCIILGAGNMGNALANYENFKKRGYDILAIFDVDENKIGKKINKIEVYSTDKLKEFVTENKIDIAILTVPNNKIIDAAKEVISLGIKGIWNFSPSDLRLGEDIVVENVHLSDSLMVLGYRLRENEN
ncbi:MAG: redox-sensing transcriptional repressor Rex [Acetivibrionales bacterium]|jgi:redox-sensing transcriptional repressor